MQILAEAERNRQQVCSSWAEADEVASQRQSGSSLVLSITILLQKLYSSSLIFAMLGAYNNTVKNPDPEKIVKPISAMLLQHCRPCCYCTNTETFLIQWSTNICQKHTSSENKLEWTQLLQKQGERNSSLNRRSEAATERVSVVKVRSGPGPPGSGAMLPASPHSHRNTKQRLQINLHTA